ncbi:hypothetical protein PG994_004871 [Apiospora phragmitis]|uniref:Uncharacterized protein n=1 Tax=Apiospora phragmitis TaxID=2905665 RepID=A0ABR1VT14_9PEZI
MDLMEFGRVFQPMRRQPHEYSIYVYHSKLVEAVKKLKLEIYGLYQFAADNSTVHSRDQLKVVMTMAGELKTSFENVNDLHITFMDHLATWKAL